MSERARNLWKGPPPEKGPVALKSRRLYILPTAQGWSFAFVAFVILIGSINYQSSLGFLLGFLLASLGVAAMFSTHRNLLGLELEIFDAKPVFAGENAVFKAVLKGSSRGPRYALTLKVREGEAAEADVYESDTPLDLSRTGLARGVRTLGRVTVETSFPLGFFRAWAPVESAASVVVYPAPLHSARLPHGEAPPGEGELTVNFKKGGPDDFSGLKQYAPGDNLARIHWKAAARGGELVVKEFEQPAGAVLLFDYALHSDEDPERILSLLAGQLLEAEEAGAGYGLKVGGLEIAPGRGPVHLAECLSALARFNP